MLKCVFFSDLNGLSLKKIVKVKSIAHNFKFIYLPLLTRSVWNIIDPGSYNLKIYKKNPDYTDTFVTIILKLKSATCVYPPRSRLRYCRLLTLYLF